ncbi:MAG: bifunctional DNA-binding transcriptional regulator/O6-methylguanine-DNA methyltransferase Ada [Ktedonobacteraceae bacterium]
MNETYWEAVLAKDSHADGQFVYAVRSTGIYCNPSCPSRRPKREHVVFFTLAHAAEEAGFRPCRRCRPGEAHTDTTTLVQSVCRYIEAHSEETLTLAQLGAQAHISPYHLQRLFKGVVGVTPRQYIQTHRMARLKTQIKEGETVTHALYDVGYGSSSRLYEQAPTQLGMTPTNYRNGGKGMSIRYTLVDCPLGRLLVATTERGICAVELGDTDATLEAALHKEYPAAHIQHDSTILDQEVQLILRHLNGEQQHLDLPLDIQATAFQCRVWQELRTIPYGETRSYREVAASLGDVNKARAVAEACAANPVALIVPCHRVVREDSSFGGYRWGTERKYHLLTQEGSQMKA